MSMANKTPGSKGRSWDLAFLGPPFRRSLVPLGDSPRAVTTVDAQISTRHKATGIAKQEDGRSAVLAGVAEATEHVGVGPVPLPLGEGFEETGRHGCDDVTGRDRVDTDSMLTPFSCQVARELDDARFRGVIGTAKQKSVTCGLSMFRWTNLRAYQTPISHGPAHTSDEHQTTFLLPLDHLSCHRLGRHEHSGNVDTHHFVDIFTAIL